MKRRRLGRTGLVVSEIGLGTMTFGSMADETQSRAILDRAFDAGVDFLDVAEIYPVPPDSKWAGASEEIVGKWLADRPRDAVVIATKVAGPGGGWFKTPLRSGRTALDRHHVERAVEASLRRLRTDYIDLYQTHWPDAGLPLEVTLEALDRVVQEGKVRYVGCSNQTAYGLTKSLWISETHGFVRYETIQNNWSLLNRRFEDALAEACRHEQVSLLPYSPLAGGVLTGKYQDGAWPPGARFSVYRERDPRTKLMTARFVNDRTLAATARFAGIAREHATTPTAFATAWSLAHDFVGSTLVGATRAEQLDEILAAADLVLAPEAMAAVDRISKEILYPLG
ncbi:NDP-hexose C3-ketoreductase / dTDP-4-oxo-2-deoxy-alpha-D-pentos-2-ene 2,3-reductase [Myxococcaceae bacterium]|jgi:aryl-alcohol dehydrogenase-like predicted oxidoreductase|nr:NDP-hexose C3-ketoreductase / dTDP-4-oxo-2-deoxy-alpha-D-pentos-2-ene 2,3-reductase [Myxococcaceae bacterium]